MSNGDDNDLTVPETGDDALAAEYVLGVLPFAERAAAAARVEVDPAFARRVAGWERRLSPFDDETAPVAPPPALKSALDRRLFGEAQKPAGWWRSLALWRPLAIASLAACALLAGMLANEIATRPPESVARLVVQLEAPDSPVKMLALFEPGSSAVRLSAVSGTPDSGRDFELWLIEGDNPPASLGVLPPSGAATLDIPESLQASFAAGATLAISVEPAGGSPTGQPTGPVVAAGQLRAI
ncbi:MAG TPA: anti-sigma factor [Rhizobiaceae bacterium]|nr:anti-sigma factor [Rhizobiaceae bacterium]